MNTRLTLAAFTFLLVGACSTPVATVGRYQLDQQNFGEMLADRLIEMGKVPKAARTAVVETFKGTEFTVELREDGTFTRKQVVLGNEHTYTGTWKLEGSSIELSQTHADGQEQADRISGTLVDGKFSLVHESTGQKYPLVLFHEASPAAPSK